MTSAGHKAASAGAPAVVVPITDPRSVPVIGTDHHLPPIASERLSAPALRGRFRDPPDWRPDFYADHQRPEAGTQPASVLMAIVDHHEGPTMLLTQRTAHLNRHSGQVAFPGGRQEEDDRDPIAAALREAQEEVGLDPARVEVLGALPVYITGTQYRITPVVALLQPGHEYDPHPGEVESVFEVPLAFLMNPGNHQRRHFVSDEGERQFISMPWRVPGGGREYLIWGATAAILRNFYRMLSA